ncbi:MAG: type II toxin-antitoxin system VapC family toxin [Chloroflexi bacterium]|nr:type II toxin-antitoxin system VapC family toxin [Chloroflexota bacterium]
MSYLLDADCAIQAIAGHGETAVMLNRLTPPRIFLSWITVAEIYEGAFRSSNPRAEIAQFREFLFPYRKLVVNESIVERFAEIRAFLRRRGLRISDADVYIGATALEYDFTVLTNNVRHLERIPDVKLYRPG